ncbi:3-keto-5-aminohexanoate cleavage protein [Nitratireductor mangrovi]|uniref:3-keto-5-aminohexanoate cleavage protein n=1 Tax=Nitratireductor mangrovi TaxID=2599600 RepID=A0A5B8KXJ4_9HYPH|nr:3-keto-5-aminohexanoate cleavage protein [Nitratireductor mangrovi]QDZ00333.1 3-keto-5-aminohexanoate cleavage protein [Nitratireductor mangrovi]
MDASAHRPVAIAVAPNGGRLTKADHPALPVEPSELAATASACRDAGAAMIHLHVRDRDGRHLLDAEAYRRATDAVRAAVGDELVVQITSEALGIYSPAEQMDVVRSVRPEAVSLALRELAPDEAAEAEFATFLAWLSQERIVPQIILYEPGEACRLDDMARRGVIPFDSIPVLFVLGRYVPGQQSAPDDVLPFLAPDMPRFESWMLCAFGLRETACVTAAALLGGNARVGFENNLFLPDGRRAPDNAALVEATATAIGASGLRSAVASELREEWAGMFS